jgi:hypothetical protein
MISVADIETCRMFITSIWNMDGEVQVSINRSAGLDYWSWRNSIVWKRNG